MIEFEEMLEELINKCCAKGCEIRVCAGDVRNPKMSGFKATVEGFEGRVSRNSCMAASAVRKATYFYLYGEG